MLKTYEPKLIDLWFKELMLADEKTMSYNHDYGGTIPFGKDKQIDWYKTWFVTDKDKRYYRYLKDDDNNFVGEISYHFDSKINGYYVDVLIYAKYRHKGYGKEGLKIICEVAKKNGLIELYDDIAYDNKALNLFIKQGFTILFKTDKIIRVVKKL